MTDLRAMFTRLSLFDDGGLLAELQVKPTWIEQVRRKQLGDKSLELRFHQVESGDTIDFGINSDWVLCFRGRICVPSDEDLRRSILKEAHSSNYAMHPGGNKMYRDLRELCKVRPQYYVSSLNDDQSKRVIQILEDILRRCVIEFRGSWEDYLPLVEFAYNNSFKSSIQLAPYEALYGHKCQTPLCWIALGKGRVLSPKLVSENEDKVRLIRDRLKVASDRQKSYVDLNYREIEYSVGDFVFLKISP
ncbi:uncharacterized protein LOC108468255 [Gossypium arboreum]|uniref:uncharacterized protein LOC108468255 n=1 Tax=Gossypium arboreum TaxID=29729 RepID=UPI0008193C1D|nr:uncharacterized protein LOC108468255 [Gossypium arboreum]